jgi:hypothetical protein
MIEALEHQARPFTRPVFKRYRISKTRFAQTLDQVFFFAGDGAPLRLMGTRFAPHHEGDKGVARLGHGDGNFVLVFHVDSPCFIGRSAAKIQPGLGFMVVE